MNDRRVMGIDLALGRTGLALPDGTTLNVTPTGAGYRKIADLALTVLAIVDTAKPDLVVLEDYAPNSLGTNSTIRSAEAGGVVRTHLTLRHHDWRTVAPNTLKKYATGNGRATKEEMVTRAIELGAAATITHDEADAYFLRRYGIELMP